MLIRSPASYRIGIFCQQRPRLGWPYNLPSTPENFESERELCDTRTASINQDCPGPTPTPIHSCPNYKVHKYDSQHTVPQLVLSFIRCCSRGKERLTSGKLTFQETNDYFRQYLLQAWRYHNIRLYYGTTCPHLCISPWHVALLSIWSWN